MSTMSWGVGVITAPREQSTLIDTLKSLSRAGWQKPVITYDGQKPLANYRQLFANPGKPGCYQNWRYMASQLILRFPRADYLLITEDDIELTPGLRFLLERQRLPQGVVSLYTGSINHRPDSPGWNQVEKLPKHAHGALAYIWRPRLLWDFLHADINSDLANGTDTHVGMWCRRAQVSYWCHTPSFVRHTGVTSTLPPAGQEIYRQCAAFCD